MGSKPHGEGAIICKFHETPFKMWIIELVYIQLQCNYSYLSEDLTVFINKRQIKCRFNMYKEAKPKEPWVGLSRKTHLKQFYFYSEAEVIFLQCFKQNYRHVKQKYSKDTQIDYNRLHNTTYAELNGKFQTMANLQFCRALLSTHTHTLAPDQTHTHTPTHSCGCYILHYQIEIFWINFYHMSDK